MELGEAFCSYCLIVLARQAFGVVPFWQNATSSRFVKIANHKYLDGKSGQLCDMGQPESRSKLMTITSETPRFN